jgi:hypothetical protein
LPVSPARDIFVQRRLDCPWMVRKKPAARCEMRFVAAGAIPA